MNARRLRTKTPAFLATGSLPDSDSGLDPSAERTPPWSCQVVARNLGPEPHRASEEGAGTQ